MSRPNLTKEQILFWIHKFRKLNPKKLEHRRRLINSFLNSVYLFDDKIIIDCNYKEGTETITFEEIEKSVLGSDLTSLTAPEKDLNFDKKLRSFSAKSVLRRDKSATQMKSLRDEILLMQGYKDGFNFIQTCLDFIVL